MQGFSSTPLTAHDPPTHPQRSVEMEGKNFIKLCKDCKLMSKALTTTDIDLIFTKVKTKGARKIPFDQFVNAVDAIAAKKVREQQAVAAVGVTVGYCSWKRVLVHHAGPEPFAFVCTLGKWICKTKACVHALPQPGPKP